MQKILIVEDDRPIANLIKVSLAAEGYSCVCAYDGADDYITKPFQVGELTARVEAVLRRYGKAGCVLHADDVEVDIDSRVVYKAGREVELTPKEFDLLSELVRNKNVAMYREALYEKVWGGEYQDSSRTLDGGEIIICALGKGEFTLHGHFIVIYGYDGDGFKVNDPNSVLRSNRRWQFSDLQDQFRKIWGLRAGGGASGSPSNQLTETLPSGTMVVIGR